MNDDRPKLAGFDMSMLDEVKEGETGGKPRFPEIVVQVDLSRDSGPLGRGSVLTRLQVKLKEAGISIAEYVQFDLEWREWASTSFSTLGHAEKLALARRWVTVEPIPEEET